MGFRLVQRSETFSDPEGQRPAISATAELLSLLPPTKVKLGSGHFHDVEN